MFADIFRKQDVHESAKLQKYCVILLPAVLLYTLTGDVFLTAGAQDNASLLLDALQILP